MRVSLLLALALGASPSPAFETCMKAANGMSGRMLACGQREIALLDVRLNSAYRNLLTALPARERIRLRREQRRWLAHHMSETRRLADDPDNGSAAFLDSQRFELQDLGDRVRVLETEVAHRDR